MLSKTRSRFLGSTVIFCALLGLASCDGSLSKDAAARSDGPNYNVLLVTLDTTRADRLSCYGHHAPTTPSFDAFAREGARFDMAIAQAAVTPVSHASIVTGLLPPQHGVRVLYAESGYELSEDIPTLATVLEEEGWETAAFLSAFPVSEFFGFDNGFDTFDNGIAQSPDDVLQQKPDGAYRFNVKINQRRSDDTTDRAIEWIEQTEGPFFLWVHYWDPHDSIILPPASVITKFSPRSRASKAKRKLGIYDAEVNFVDRQFGRILQTLKEEGQFDDTVIVVVGDHGEGLGEHDHWEHSIIYQEQIHVPLITRLPGMPQGVVVPDLVSTTDIYPTVLEALEIDPPFAVDGKSLQGLMRGEPEPPRLAYADALIRYDLSAKELLEKRPDDDLLYCMMDCKWKLIYRPSRPDRSELYNLRKDPEELHNLYTPENEQAKRLFAELNDLQPFVDRPFGEGADEDAIERLRSLGYIDGNSSLDEM